MTHIDGGTQAYAARSGNEHVIARDDLPRRAHAADPHEMGAAGLLERSHGPGPDLVGLGNPALPAGRAQPDQLGDPELGELLHDEPDTVCRPRRGERHPHDRVGRLDRLLPTQDQPSFIAPAADPPGAVGVGDRGTLATAEHVVEMVAGAIRERKRIAVPGARDEHMRYVAHR